MATRESMSAEQKTQEKPKKARKRSNKELQKAIPHREHNNDINHGELLEGEIIDETRELSIYGHDDDEKKIIDAEEVDAYFEGEIVDEREGLLPVVHKAVEPFEEEEVEEERGLVVVSELQRYLNELRKYPLLKPEEEKELAIRAYVHNDKEAKQRLITSNLRLVVKIAMEYRRAYSQTLDLIQEGNAGLVQAVNRFNPFLGVKLSTYSAFWIRAYILKFLMDNKSLVRMGTTDAQRKLFFRLHAEAEKLYAQTQSFDARLLAQNIGVKEQDVLEMRERLSKSDVSLDAPVGDEGEARQVDFLPSSFDDPELVAEKKELSEVLQNEVLEIEKELNERDRYILWNRIMADEPVTLQEVGEKFNVTRERARQLEARILKKIKERVLAKGIHLVEKQEL